MMIFRVSQIGWWAVPEKSDPTPSRKKVSTPSTTVLLHSLTSYIYRVHIAKCTQQRSTMSASTSRQKIKVGILGATGTVGQR